jgi:hypothetical protein
MTKAPSPTRWAVDISSMLNAVLGAEHFPIRVSDVAREYSLQRFPKDPITLVAGDTLPGFDGALFRAPAGRTGWGIVYNSAITSKGRINFTLAHEFGHYLVHRLTHPDGMRCGQQDVVRWDHVYGQVEHEANEFAANFLMPFDDYRRQIDARSPVDLDQIAHCADRYEVSLIAAILRWLEYTERRAVLVVSRDGFILWARSSQKALKTGAFFRTSRGPIQIPQGSIAGRQITIDSPRAGVDLPAGVWLQEPCREMTIFSENYDFTISLLQLQDDGRRQYSDGDNEEEEDGDLVDRIRRNHGL